MQPILPPLKPIPMKHRFSVLFVERGNLDVLDGAFVLVDKNGVRTHIPGEAWRVSLSAPMHGTHEQRLSPLSGRRPRFFGIRGTFPATSAPSLRSGAPDPRRGAGCRRGPWG